MAATDPYKIIRIAGAGIEFTSPPLAGAIIGHYLDVYFGTDPRYTIILLFLGIFAGFYRLITMLRDFNKDK